VTLEETDDGKIFEIINRMQSKLIDSQGFYRSYKERTIYLFEVVVMDSHGDYVYKVQFHDTMLFRVADLTLDYSDNNSIKYDCTFKSDYITVAVNPAYTNNSAPTLATILSGNSDTQSA
jgi:hypothetical protein